MNHDMDQDAEQDETAIANFAAAMSEKMAKSRAKGRAGWPTCPPDRLWEMLFQHIEKGDPLDVACLAMMIWHNMPAIKP